MQVILKPDNLNGACCQTTGAHNLKELPYPERYAG